jgi:sarcosine oxidase subunit gamma
MELSVCGGLRVASVVARRGALDALVQAARTGLAIDLPLDPRWTASGSLVMICMGPGQWLAVHDSLDGPALESKLQTAIGRSAAICDQSSARVLLRLAGPRARDVLAKGLPIDLHPSVSAPGHAAATLIGHIGVLVWQIDQRPTYGLAVSRSYACSLYEFLLDAGAEYGVEVL